MACLPPQARTVFKQAGHWQGRSLRGEDSHDHRKVDRVELIEEEHQTAAASGVATGAFFSASR